MKKKREDLRKILKFLREVRLFFRHFSEFLELEFEKRLKKNFKFELLQKTRSTMKVE